MLDNLKQGSDIASDKSNGVKNGAAHYTNSNVELDETKHTNGNGNGVTASNGNGVIETAT